MPEPRDRRSDARQFITEDLREAIGLIADVRRLMPNAHYGAEDAADLNERLDSAEEALREAKECLPDA